MNPPETSEERTNKKILGNPEPSKAGKPTGQNALPLDSGTPIRELLYCWGGASLNVLVPKKRGKGFLKVPYGHHVNKGLSDIETALRCDISGLDGYLFIECGLKVTCYEERRQAFAAKAMALLSAHYGVRARKVSEKEFFSILIPRKG